MCEGSILSYFVTETRSGKQLDLDYFLEWRPRLWRRPFLHAIGGLVGLQDLAGKRYRYSNNGLTIWNSNPSTESAVPSPAGRSTFRN